MKRYGPLALVGPLIVGVVVSAALHAAAATPSGDRVTVTGALKVHAEHAIGYYCNGAEHAPHDYTAAFCYRPDRGRHGTVNYRAALCARQAVNHVTSQKTVTKKAAAIVRSLPIDHSQSVIGPWEPVSS